jgi:uncharacterized OB-fold protein
MKEGEVVDVEPTMVKPSEITTVSAKSFPGKIPLDYAYTAGIGGHKFYDDLAKGKLSGTWCEEREAVLIPPASFCEEGMHELSPTDDAHEIDPESGYVVAATQVFEDRAGHTLEEPVWIVQVQFPGAVGCLFGRLIDADEDEVEIGMNVVLVATDKVGPEHICFKPA